MFGTVPSIWICIRLRAQLVSYDQFLRSLDFDNKIENQKPSSGHIIRGMRVRVDLYKSHSKISSTWRDKIASSNCKVTFNAVSVHAINVL